MPNGHITLEELEQYRISRGGAPLYVPAYKPPIVPPKAVSLIEPIPSVEEAPVIKPLTFLEVEPPIIPPEGIKFNIEGTEYIRKPDNTIWVGDKHIGSVDPETGTFLKLTEKETREDREAKFKEIYEKYPKAPYTKEQMKEPWYKEKQEEQSKAQKEYEEALVFAKPFEESLAAKTGIFLLKGMEQAFTETGALITAPFRYKKQPLKEYLSIYPGFRGYEIYEEWKGTPEEPHIYTPFPSWKQWGAWLKPVLKNDRLLKLLGVDISKWEEPTEKEIADIGFATARMGMGETAEWLPWIFAGQISRGFKTILGAGGEFVFEPIGRKEAARLLAKEIASKEAIFKQTTGGRLVLMPTYDELIWDTAKQFANKPEKLIEKPIIRNIVSILNPKLIARNPVKQLKIYQGMMQDFADGATDIALRKLQRFKPPKMKGRFVIDKRIKPLTNAPLIKGEPSMEIGDILSYSERYEMPASLRAWFDEMRSISKEVTEMLEGELKKHNIVMKKLVRENDWVYFHRVVEKIGSIENLRMKTYRSMTKPRSLELAGEAVSKEVKYLENPIAELQYQIEGAYAWITDLRVKDSLKKLTTTAKERVKPAIIDDLIEKNNIKNAADHLKKLISRAKRGEKIPMVSVRAVEKYLPEINEKVIKTARMTAKTSISKQKRINALNKLSKQATELLNVSQEEFWAAKSIYQRALKDAGPTIEEGTTRYFGGRIFTTQELIKPGGIKYKFAPKEFRFIPIEGKGKTILGSDLALQVEKNFGYRIPGIFERGSEKLGLLGGILRETKASLDFSVQFIQTQLGGLGLDIWNLFTLRPSANWVRGAARGIQAGFMPRSYVKWAGKPEIITAAKEMITHRCLVQPSEYTEALGVLAPLLRKTVVGRPAAFAYSRANAAFTAGRVSTATYMWMGERQLATKGLTGVALAHRLDELGMWINKSTGVLSTGGMGMNPTQRSLEAIFMFAPRYTRAVVASVMDIGRGGYTGAQAREALLGLITAGYTFFTFVPLALGQKPRLNPLPESVGGDGAKWLTVQVGNSYVGVGGTIYGLARLIANNWTTMTDRPEDYFMFNIAQPEQWMKDPNIRFIRGKFGPPIALGVDFVTGHGYLGNLTRENWHQVMGTALDWLIPIWMEGVVGEEWYEHLAEKEPLATHPEAALPEILGMRTIPVTEYDKYMTLRDVYAMRDLGVHYRDIEDSADRDALFRNHLDLEELRQKVALDFEKRGGTFERWYAEDTRRVNKERNEKMEVLATALLNGEISKQEYDNQRRHIRSYYSGYKAALWDAREKFDADTIKAIEKYAEEQSDNDRALDEYQEIRATPEIDPVTEMPDWDKREKDLRNFLAGLSSTVREYVLAHRNDYMLDYLPNTQRLERLFAECEEGLDGYYTQPEGRQRLIYRQTNPIVDIKLNLLGRANTVQSDAALRGLKQSADEWGIPYTIFPALMKAPAAPRALSHAERLRDIMAGIEIDAEGHIIVR